MKIAGSIPTKGLNLYLDPNNRKCYKGSDGSNSEAERTAINHLIKPDSIGNWTTAVIDVGSGDSDRVNPSYFDFGVNTSFNGYEPVSNTSADTVINSYDNSSNNINWDINAFSGNTEPEASIGTLVFWIKPETDTSVFGDQGTTVQNLMKLIGDDYLLAQHPLDTKSHMYGFVYCNTATDPRWMITGDQLTTNASEESYRDKVYPFNSQEWTCFAFVTNIRKNGRFDDLLGEVNTSSVPGAFRSHLGFFRNVYKNGQFYSQDDGLVSLPGDGTNPRYLDFSTIGAGNIGGSAPGINLHNYRGKLGPVMAWDRVLTQKEIQQVYFAHKPIYHP